MLLSAARNKESHVRGRGLVPGSFLLQMVNAKHLDSETMLTETEAAQQVVEWTIVALFPFGLHAHCILCIVPCKMSGASCGISKLGRRDKGRAKLWELQMLAAIGQSLAGFWLLTTCRLAQAFTFLLAGYETTASGLAFTTYCLAANPGKMAKLLEVVPKSLSASLCGNCYLRD